MNPVQIGKPQKVRLYKMVPIPETMLYIKQQAVESFGHSQKTCNFE